MIAMCFIVSRDEFARTAGVVHEKRNCVITPSELPSSLPGPWLLLPFLLQLLAIALMPLVALHWWEKNLPKVSLLLGGIVVAYYLFAVHGNARLLDALHEYTGFIILMASLFIVAGGVHIGVKGEATPLRNVFFLLIAVLLANVIGTTGSSMLLIRPWVRMNRYRITGFHTVFFIFLVSNVGGSLTPIGDPPLFLGFLRGVPFWWTLQHLWQPWMLVVGLLLTAFFLMDRENFLRSPAGIRKLETLHEEWNIQGLGNLLPLAAILGAVFLPTPWREITMCLAALLSWYLTPRMIHERNNFSFAPIKEVAWIFLGIFATMIPALDYLEHHADSLAETLGMGSFHFYYLTGILSSLLDNAPTYLAFLSVELGMHGASVTNPEDVLRIATEDPAHLIAISTGAVFFGAMSYIGNGPNFMVKSIVTESGVKTPDFFEYILRYALPILLPVLALAGWLFLR